MIPNQTTVNGSVPSRNNYRRALPWAGLLLLVPIVALAGQGNSPFTLRMKFKTGESHKYQTTAKADVETPMFAQAGGMKMETTAVQIQKVQKTLPDGGAEVEVTTTDSKTTMNGQPMGGNTPPVTIIYDARGVIRGIKGMAQTGNAMMGNIFNSGAMQMQGAFLPPTSVKPGDKWSASFKMTGITTGATAKSEFLKVEKVGRYRTAKIRTKVTAPMNLSMDAQSQPTTDPKKAAMNMSGAMNMTIDTNFAIADGKVIRTGGNGIISMSMKPLGQAAQPPKTAPKSPPARGQKPKPTAAPAAIKINVKMQMGSNLIE